MPASAYLQRRHRKITGLVEASRAAKCYQCGGLSPRSDMLKGWCVPCVLKWRAAADPVMLAQAALGYSPQSCISAPSPRAVGQITEAIIRPKNDAEFLPLLMFLGNQTIGRMQALWNLLKTMQVLEVATTHDVFKLTKASHDTTHRCGLHAPVQNSTLNAFLSRLSSVEDFAPLKQDRQIHEYLRWFIANNRVFLYRLTPISPTAYRTKQSWRRIEREKWQPLLSTWPFLRGESSSDHRELLAVDSVIPKGIPEQWRQDMCQDLMVALLSGDVTLENMRDAAGEYIKRVWREHPLKYGALSLDAPAPWARDDGRTLGSWLSDVDLTQVTSECEHRYDHHGQGTWHEGFDRPVGLARIGDVLRDKNSGLTVPGLTPTDNTFVMDEEIEEVYRQDRQPRGYVASGFAATSRLQPKGGH